MNRIKYFLTSSLGVIVSLTLLGCGNIGDRPSLGEVTGIVTLDGKPIQNVLVRFEPEGVRASQGVTNSQGEYRLRYIRDIMGAAVGGHSVTIQDNTGKKRIPKKYQKEPLEKVVDAGSNRIDIQLSSGA